MYKWYKLKCHQSAAKRIKAGTVRQNWIFKQLLENHSRHTALEQLQGEESIGSERDRGERERLRQNRKGETETRDRTERERLRQETEQKERLRQETEQKERLRQETEQKERKRERETATETEQKERETKTDSFIMPNCNASALLEISTFRSINCF